MIKYIFCYVEGENIKRMSCHLCFPFTGREEKYLVSYYIKIERESRIWNDQVLVYYDKT